MIMWAIAWIIMFLAWNGARKENKRLSRLLCQQRREFDQANWEARQAGFRYGYIVGYDEAKNERPVIKKYLNLRTGEITAEVENG